MTVKITINHDYYEGYFYNVYDPKYDTDQEIEISKDKHDEFVKIEKAYRKMKEELEHMVKEGKGIKSWP